MSLKLFQKVPAGAIETLSDDQNQPLFKRLHHALPRSEIEGVGMTDTLGKTKASHDIFINLHNAIEIAVRSKKLRAVHLVKWLTKKGKEKIQEEHQQAITGHGNQIKSLEFRNEEHQQKILRLNKEIDDLIANRHIARRGCFRNVLPSSKRTAKKFTHITLFNVSTDSLKNINNGLNFVK